MKIFVTATTVALMTTSASAQYVTDPLIRTQQQFDEAMDFVTARNLFRDSDCYIPISEDGAIYMQTIFASSDIENYARDYANYMISQGCDVVSTFLEERKIVPRLEVQAAIMNHPVIQQQQNDYNDIILRAQQDVLKMLDEHYAEN